MELVSIPNRNRKQSCQSLCDLWSRQVPQALPVSCNNQASICWQTKTVSFNQYCQQISSRRIASPHYNHPQKKNKHKDYPQDRHLLTFFNNLFDSLSGLFNSCRKCVFWVWCIGSYQAIQYDRRPTRRSKPMIPQPPAPTPKSKLDREMRIRECINQSRV